MSAIELVNVTQGSRADQVLNDVSFRVAEGEACALVGPNGSGKSTVLRLIASIIVPSSGSIRVLGHDTVRESAAVRRAVGFVADAFGAYPGLRVVEYLEFFAGAQHVRNSVSTIKDLLALVDLEREEKQYLSALSRGKKQRLALAKALLHDPAILLLDEPTFGLDWRGRTEMLSVLEELRAMGKTIVLSSHLLDDVSQLATDVVALQHGRVAAQVTLEELRQSIEGPRRMVLEVVNDPRLALSVLEPLPTVQGADWLGQVVRFTFSGSRYDLPELVAQLVAHQVRVVRFSEESTDLEVLLASLQREARTA